MRSAAVALATLAATGCGASSTVSPSPQASPPEAASATAATNAAPEILGDDLCVGPVGRAHVYPLRLVDPEGEPLAWSAAAAFPRGVVFPRAGTVPSGTTIEVVYEPPSDRADENVIVVTATDPRGAAVTKRLVARSG